jgi:hypothetical protein
MESKTCSKCKEFKLNKEFSRRGNGLRSTCKVCDKAYREDRKKVKELSLFAKIVGWFNR